MRFQEIIQAMADVASDHDIPLLLVWGWALSAYGVSRQTIDVDFVGSDADLPRIRACLEALGYREAFRNELFVKFRSTGEGGPDVDFLLMTDDTLAKLLHDCVWTTVGASRLRVPSLRHLIGMKLHALKYGRARRGSKDLADIEALVRANDLDVSSESFRDLCLRYADRTVYREICPNDEA